MRRASTLAAAAVAALCGAGLVDSASAQESAARRPNPVIPHGGQTTPSRLTAAPGPVRHGLTPANAWMRPPAAPAPAATPPAPHPVAAAPQPARPQPAPVQRPAVDFLPDNRGQAAPVEAVYAPPPAPVAQPTAQPAVQPDAGHDPMAPRRDAPIFRMQQGATPQALPAEAAAQATAADPAAAPAEQAPRPMRVATVVNTGEQPPQQGARYYSVHRQNGRQPDALAMPTPTYVDALAVTMAETPASQDLAQPDQGPALIRDAQGRVRAMPAASDGDHQ